MRFISRAETAARFAGRTVAIVGSGPGVLDNPAGMIDGHDIVVRVNNYGVRPPATGTRTDVFHSVFGRSIRKTRAELEADGVTLCMCKCPDAMPFESPWHVDRGRLGGIDFRRIYARRQDWWFCDTYVPTVSEFLRGFDLLGGHVPTSGFAAILDVASFAPAAVYLTGFDFFRSGVHDVDRRWRPGNPNDPIGHVPERELAWLAARWASHPFSADPALTRALETAERF